METAALWLVGCTLESMVSARAHPAPRPLNEPRLHPPKKHDLAGFLGAFALHAGVLGLALVAPASGLSGKFWVPVEDEVEVDLWRSPAVAAPASGGAESGASEDAVGTFPVAPFVRPPESGARPAKVVLAPREAPFDLPTPDVPQAPEYDGPAPAVPLSPGAQSLVLVPIEGLGEQGSLGGEGASARTGKPAAKPVEPAPKPGVDRTIATRVLSAPLAQHKADLGLTLPAAGNIASALRTTVRSALGPTSGSATFLAILTPAGQLLAIQPVAMNGGSAEAWASAAQAAAASLAGRSFSMIAPFQNGAAVWIDVTSTFVLPSGAAAPVSGEPGGVRFDVSDIGRRKQQVVRTRLRVAPVR